MRTESGYPRLRDRLDGTYVGQNGDRYRLVISADQKRVSLNPVESLDPGRKPPTLEPARIVQILTGEANDFIFAPDPRNSHGEPTMSALNVQQIRVPTAILRRNANGIPLHRLVNAILSRIRPPDSP